MASNEKITTKQNNIFSNHIPPLTIKLSELFSFINNGYNFTSKMGLVGSFRVVFEKSTSERILIKMIPDTDYPGLGNNIDVDAYRKVFPTADPYVYVETNEGEVAVEHSHISASLVKPMRIQVNLSHLFNWLDTQYENTGKPIFVEMTKLDGLTHDKQKRICVSKIEKNKIPEGYEKEVKDAGKPSAYFKKKMFTKEDGKVDDSFMNCGVYTPGRWPSWLSFEDLENIHFMGSLSQTGEGFTSKPELYNQQGTDQMQIKQETTTSTPGVGKNENQIRLKEFKAIINSYTMYNNIWALKADFFIDLKTSNNNEVYITVADAVSFTSKTNNLNVDFHKDQDSASDPLVFFLPAGNNGNISAAQPVTKQNVIDLFLGNLSNPVDFGSFCRWLNHYEKTTGFVVLVSFALGAYKQMGAHSVFEINGLRSSVNELFNTAEFDIIRKGGGSLAAFEKSIPLGMMPQYDPDNTYITISYKGYLTYGDLDNFSMVGFIGVTTDIRADINAWFNGPSTRPAFAMHSMHNQKQAQGVYPTHQFAANPNAAKLDKVAADNVCVVKSEFGDQKQCLKSCVRVVMSDENIPELALQYTPETIDKTYDLIIHFLKKNVIKSYRFYDAEGNVTQEVTVS